MNTDTRVCTTPNLWWLLQRACAVAKRRQAVVDGSVRLTFDGLRDWAARMAEGTAERGLGPGERVAVLAANSAGYLASYFGIPGGGHVFVPLNARLADAELEFLIADSGASLLLVDQPSHERGAALASRTATLLATFDDLLRAPAPADLLAGSGRARGEDLAAIFYTGGTTGRPKGAVLTHANLAANAVHMIAGLQYGSEDVYLHSSPMFHLGDGMNTYPVTWAAGTHVLIPKFDPAAVIAAIESERVTCTFLVPTMLTLLLEHLGTCATQPDLSSLRLIVHGGAPIAPALLETAMARLGCSFTQSYGMTEAGPILSFLPREEARLGSTSLRSAGQPVVGVEVRIARPDGSNCDVGEVGEIVARGPNFALGYWNQPDVTAQKFRDGWYWSGDLAYRDDEYYLYIVGRTGEAIISGGENIYAAEVEAALANHADVVEAAVIAVPSERWGEQVHAAVVLRGDAAVTGDDLTAHCRTLIAGYKIPRSYEFHYQLPRTGPGKIDKLALRAPHWAGHAREVS